VRRARARGSAALLVASSAIALVLGGCDPATTASPDGSAPPATSTAEASRAPGEVAVDPGLLDILPPTIDGLAVTPAQDAAEIVVEDQSLADWIGSVAYAVVLEPDTGETAIVAVVGVRDGEFGELAFRGYRDTFDPAACERAGGMAGNAQAEVGGRTTYIATCTEGVVIYHLHLTDPDRVVSVTSVGDGSLGRRVVEAIEG
jgi:hypothetical protein